MVEFVLLNILKFGLSNLKHFSNSYRLFKLHFNFQKGKTKPRQAGLTAGQAGPEAGTVPEAAGPEPAQAGAQAGAVAERSGPQPAQAGRAGRAHGTAACDDRRDVAGDQGPAAG